MVPAAGIAIYAASGDPISTAAFASLATFHALRALAHHRNRTVMAILGNRLSVETGPIAFGKRVELATSEIAALERKENVPFGFMSYSIVARLRDGRRVVILRKLPSARHALWISELLATSIESDRS